MIIPNILNSFKNWSNKSQAAIDPKTPSNEKIIATGAGDKFCWANIWSIKAIPLDKTPAYKSSVISIDITFNEINSKEKAGTNEIIDAVKHWNVAIEIG